uniref:Uncharacterized protein n=1 Tax=viral metagenome TaxID=1070528 RepID=A0A6M3LY10_9ZZZZ
MRIGKHRIILGGKYIWFQTHVPTIIRRFWIFWILTEVDVDSWTEKKKFSLGETAYCEGTHWHYCKAGKDIKVGLVEE